MQAEEQPASPGASLGFSGFGFVLCALLALSAIVAVPAAGHPGLRLAIAEGHWDFGIEFEGQTDLPSDVGSWRFFLWDYDRQERLDLDDVILVVDGRYNRPIPAGATWQQVIGPARAPHWTLPQNQVPGQVYLGFTIMPQPYRAFAGNSPADNNGRVDLELAKVSGSGPDRGGDFVMYSLSGIAEFPDPDNVWFSTRTPGRRLEGLPIRNSGTTHEHYNWAFTRPGYYEVSIRVGGELRDSGMWLEGEGSLAFVVSDRAGLVPGFGAVAAHAFPWVWHPALGWVHWVAATGVAEGWLIQPDGEAVFWTADNGHFWYRRGTDSEAGWNYSRTR